MFKSNWFLLFCLNMFIIYCYILKVETAVGDIQDKMVTEERQILAQREKANRKRRGYSSLNTILVALIR